MKKIKKKVIILAGPSGSGKSSVARLLARKGYRWLKADELARGLYQPGELANAKILRAFGLKYFDTKGRVDRKRLGELVFSSRTARERLNAILYPALTRELRRQIKASGEKTCVDMAVYFDAGRPDFGAKVMLVDAPLSLRVKRLMKKGIEPKRAKAQASALKFGAKQRVQSDMILQNSGTASELRTALNLLLQKYVAS